MLRDAFNRVYTKFKLHFYQKVFEKIQSKEDKREYHLRVTQKYLDYYNISYQYLDTVLNRLENRFTPEELAVVEKVLKVMDEELMPEIPI